MKRLFTCAAVGFGAAFASTAMPASAVVVNITQSGIVGANNPIGTAFNSQGFTPDTVGSTPSSAVSSPSFSGSASWTMAGGGEVVNDASLDASNGPTTGFSGLSGDKYLTISRTGTASSGFFANFARTINPTNDKFTVEFALYQGAYAGTGTTSVQNPYSIFSIQPTTTAAVSGGTQLAGFGFRFSATGVPEVIRMVNNTGNGASAATVTLIPGLQWNPDSWNTVQFSWDPTAAAGQRALLTLNNNAPVNVQTSTDVFSNSIVRLNARHNAASTTLSEGFHIDAIPEPASMGVVIGAAALLMARRRRSRSA